MWSGEEVLLPFLATTIYDYSLTFVDSGAGLSYRLSTVANLFQTENDRESHLSLVGSFVLWFMLVKANLFLI